MSFFIGQKVKLKEGLEAGSVYGGVALLGAMMSTDPMLITEIINQNIISYKLENGYEYSALMLDPVIEAGIRVKILDRGGMYNWAEQYTAMRSSFTNPWCSANCASYEVEGKSGTVENIIPHPTTTSGMIALINMEDGRAILYNLKLEYYNNGKFEILPPQPAQPVATANQPASPESPKTYYNRVAKNLTANREYFHWYSFEGDAINGKRIRCSQTEQTHIFNGFVEGSEEVEHDVDLECLRNYIDTRNGTDVDGWFVKMTVRKVRTRRGTVDKYLYTALCPEKYQEYKQVVEADNIAYAAERAQQEAQRIAQEIEERHLAEVRRQREAREAEERRITEQELRRQEEARRRMMEQEDATYDIWLHHKKVM